VSIVIAHVEKNGNIFFGYDYQITDDNLGRPGTHDKAFIRNISAVRPIEIGFGVVGIPALLNTLAYSLEIPEYTGTEFTDKEIDQYVFASLVPAIAISEQVRASSWGLEGIASSIMIGVLGKLYSLDHIYNAVRYSSVYDAIGSGSQVALGACAALSSHTNMSPARIVHAAVSITIDSDVTCCGPVGMLRVLCE